jgi:hypothetical protein
MSNQVKEKPENHGEFIKFDLYIDAVGDGAARSRGIIGLLMTATLVAGLGLFNSLRTEHNWFSSRLESLHELYGWLAFSDDKEKEYIRFAKEEKDLYLFHDSLLIRRDTVTKMIDTVAFFRLNTFSWKGFKAILSHQNIRFDSFEEKMPPHLRFKFPAYCMNRDGTIDFVAIRENKSELEKVLMAAQKANAVNREEMTNLLVMHDRARIENALLVRMPILGISFDVNWLGFISSVAFSIILFLLYYSLSRERKNLFLVFKVAEKRNVDKLDFYQMLSMRQVLNVPQSIDQYVFETDERKTESRWENWIRKFTNQMGRYPLYTPAVVWILILAHDVSTFSVGLAINSSLTIISFILSLTLGAIMLFFVHRCWLEWSGIIDVWDKQADEIKKRYGKDSHEN